MNLQLAIVMSYTDTHCQIRYLDEDTQTEAVYAEPFRDYEIEVLVRDLVAVDRDSPQPRIVFRWRPTRVKRIEGTQVFFEHGSTFPHRIADDLHTPIAVDDEVYPYFGQIVGAAAEGKPISPEQLSAICFPHIHTMYQSLDTLYQVGPKRIVEQSYDQISEPYEAWIQTIDVEVRDQYIASLIDRLPAGAKVLDLGCGSGIPVTQQLAQHFQVTGVDISTKQIERARQAIPHADFIKADMTQISLPTASFDAITALGSIIHVPRDEQPKLLQDIATWLRPGGSFLATFGARSMKIDFEANWLGALMYWSYFDSQTNVKLVKEAGLSIISAREEGQMENGKLVTFQWIVAEKPN